jgi:hypothetical protein
LKRLHARFLAEDIGAPFPAHVGAAALGIVPPAAPPGAPAPEAKA